MFKAQLAGNFTASASEKAVERRLGIMDDFFLE